MNSLEEFIHFCEKVGVSYRRSETLSRYSSLRIGGIADIIVFPSPSQLKEIVEFISRHHINSLTIGGGTNVLFPDEGFSGVVISTTKMDNLFMHEDGASLTIEAGVNLWRLISKTAELGLSGIEGLSGIPGTVGGAIKGNAGSFGCEIKDVVKEVTLLSLNGDMLVLKRDEITFGYRSSSITDDAIIVNSLLSFIRHDVTEVKRKIREVINQKKAGQPVYALTAGCVFKNPEGHSAGRLIDEAGCKGMRRGDIMVSPLHANFLVNMGNGRASDFLTLMEMVKERVFRTFGITLEPEIRIIKNQNLQMVNS